jgi:anion-transporting  ArsA/GET3 family ATPase
MAAADELPPLHSRRFLFVTGKGGVGKTTVTAGLALAFAARGKRVLVAMGGAHERLSAILQTPAIGHDIVQLRERVWATKIEPERAIEEYGELVIKVRAVTRLVFESQYTHAFFRAAPGLYEWAMLGKAWYHTTEQSADGSARFDAVLFDAPSTGHALHMLRIPAVIMAVAPRGVLRRDAELAAQGLRDPARAGVVVVGWPEEMAVSETIELVEAVRNDLGMPVARLVLNGLLPQLFSSRERQALLAEPASGTGGRVDAGASPSAQLWAAATRRASREELQQRSCERLRRAVGVPMGTLPFLVEGAGTPEGAQQLADRLY